MGNKDIQQDDSILSSVRAFIDGGVDLFLAPLFKERAHIYKELKAIQTPLPEAILESKRRRQDPELRKRVREYLRGDIPEHFDRAEPTLYLSRHIASPNNETLRFLDITRHYDMPVVIGQDTEDRFVSNNTLKRNLGKMPVIKGVARNGDEIIEHFTIIDFAENQGRRLRDIFTKFGTGLQQFHNKLLAELSPVKDLEMPDESAWVSRNDRGNLQSHYTRLLALQIVHGIMFEYFEPEDDTFVQDILLPSFKEVERIFGLKPLLVNLVDPELELKTDWNAYPSAAYQYVKRELP